MRSILRRTNRTYDYVFHYRESSGVKYRKKELGAARKMNSIIDVVEL